MDGYFSTAVLGQILLRSTDTIRRESEQLPSQARLAGLPTGVSFRNQLPTLEKPPR